MSGLIRRRIFVGECQANYQPKYNSETVRYMKVYKTGNMSYFYMRFYNVIRISTLRHQTPNVAWQSEEYSLDDFDAIFSTDVAFEYGSTDLAVNQYSKPPEEEEEDIPESERTVCRSCGETHSRIVQYVDCWSEHEEKRREKEIDAMIGQIGAMMLKNNYKPLGGAEGVAPPNDI